MTQQAQAGRSPLRRLGRGVTIFGATLTGISVAKQWKVPSLTELHYWDWLTGSLVIIILGLLIQMAAMKKQP